MNRKRGLSRSIGRAFAGMVALLVMAPATAGAQGYDVTTAPLGMATINGDPSTVTHFDGSVALFSNDAVVVTLPFDFVFFGQVFAAGSPVTISTTGYLALGDFTGRTGSNTNSTLPGVASGLPDAMICPFWDRVTGRASARVQSLARGPTGAREFLVEWHDTGDSTAQVFGQAVLREGSQVIEFRYAPNIDPGGATVGLEDPTATVGIQPFGVNVGTIPFNLVFSPSNTPELSVEVERTQSRAGAGETLLLERTVRNRGATATGVLVHYVLSEDGVIDASDPVFATETLSTLAGATDSTVSLTLPSTIAPDQFGIGVIVDPLNAFAEADETDNSALAFPMDALRSRYQREVFPIGSYASILGTGETRLFDGMVNPALSSSMTVPLPFSFEFFSAPQSSIRISTSGCVTFDAAISDVDLASFLGNTSPAGVIGVVWSFLEVETGTAGVVATKVEGAPGSRVFIVEWSGLEEGRDDTPPVGDISAQLRLYEGSHIIEMRYPDPASQDFSSLLRYWTRLERPDGLETIVGRTFGSEELAPTRNLRFVPATGGAPDLAVLSLELLQTHAAQTRDLLLSLDVVNNGASQAGTTDVEVFLSRDATITPADLAVGTLSVAGVGAGEVRNERLAVTLPATVPDGLWHVGVRLTPVGGAPDFEPRDNLRGITSFVTTMLRVGDPQLTPTLLPTTGYQSVVGMAGATTHFSEATTPGFDDAAVQIPLPFTWTFGARTVTELVVTTNGWAAPAFAQNSGLPVAIPSTSAPRGGLFVCWDDLQSNGVDSAVVTATLGTAPSRVFVVEWFRLREFGSGGSISGQAHIHEGTNRVELRYPDPLGQDWQNVRATVGIQGDSGLRAWSPVSLGNRRMAPPDFGLALTPLVYSGVELAVTGSVSLTPIVPPGATAGLRVELTNLGDAAAGAFDVALLFSSDATLDAGDLTLATAPVPSLAPGQSTMVELVGAVPVSTPLGAAFIGARLDPAGALTETILGNNLTTAQPIMIATTRDLPDLAIQSGALLLNSTFRLGAGPSDSPPGLETLDITAVNQGSVDVPNATIRLLYSEDMDFDERDAEALNTFVTRTIAAGSSVTVSRTAEFRNQGGISPGSGFFAVEVLRLGQEETSFANNLSAIQPITVLPALAPDLIPTAVTATPAIVGPGDSLTIQGVLRNIGGLGFSETVRVAVRFSRDNEIIDLNNADELFDFGVSTPTTVAAGTDLAFGPLQITVPTATAEGGGVVGLQINDSFTDANIGNNSSGRLNAGPGALLVVAAPPGPLVNLRPFGPSTSVLQRRVRTGDLLSGTTSGFANQGTTTVGPFEVGVYLHNGSLQPGVSGERIAGFTVPPLGPASVAPGQSFQATVPSLLPQNYRVSIFVDETFAVVEDNESDNGEQLGIESILVLNAELGTDLYIADLALSATAARPGDGLQLTRIIGNLGANPALAFSSALRLSADAVIDGADPLVASFAGVVGLLGLDTPRTGTVVIPVGTAAGTYTLGLVVDDGGQVAELDEMNNVRTVQLTVAGTPRCDVTGDGMVSVSDVQAVINVALGLAAPLGAEDINGDSAVNVQDVQAVIGAALGGPCP